jgi:hypothetical protein
MRKERAESPLRIANAYGTNPVLSSLAVVAGPLRRSFDRLRKPGYDVRLEITGGVGHTMSHPMKARAHEWLAAVAHSLPGCG